MKKINLSKEENNTIKKFVIFYKKTCDKTKDCDFCPFYNYVDDANTCVLVQDFLEAITNRGALNS